MRNATLLCVLMAIAGAGTASAQYGDSPLESIARELHQIRQDNEFWNLMNMTPAYESPPVSAGGYGGSYGYSRGVSTGYGSYSDPIKVKPVKKPRHTHNRIRIYTYYPMGPLWIR